MKPKRYLILPLDGIRLSDSSKSSASAKTLLYSLQPQNKAAVTNLGKELSATVLHARATIPKASKAEKKSTVFTDSTSKIPAVLEVIESLGEDSVKLVKATEEVITALRQQNPGIRVIEEKFCHRALAPRPVIPARPAISTSARALTAEGKPVSVHVVRGDTDKPVKGAEVIVFRTENDALLKKTNASGKAQFSFGKKATKLKKLYVYHEESGVWGFYKINVPVKNGTVKISLAPVDLSAIDSLRQFHGIGDSSDGKGVRVGVIDSGADIAHPDLKEAIKGGANCVPGSSRTSDDFGPDGGHGTHVAGIIAARGSSPQGVRGVAPGSDLIIYRVFEEGSDGSGSSFAVIDAIESAINDKCDIINLSLGFDQGVTDDGISAALRKARNNGILAVAAAGNDRRQPVGFPGSDDNCVAVSASGRKGLFPDTATEVADIAEPYGSHLDDFLAAFSNVGASLDFTGAGVGVVSTFPGGYGPMSGTSMACPAVAGVAARLLSRNPHVLAMTRNAERADAVKMLLLSASNSLGFGNLLEGAGLPS